jgi:hypothetical protein
MTVATILSDETFGTEDDETRLVRYEAPTTEAGWLELFESLMGDPVAAREAYANMLEALADDETIGTDVILWSADEELWDE